VTGWVFTVENFHLLLHTGFNRRFGRLPHKAACQLSCRDL
jgi:hypothetical protein